MVKKNIAFPRLEKTTLYKCVICANLSEKEIRFIESLANLYGYKMVPFTGIKNINPLSQELVYLKEINLGLIDELLDWCIEISIVGKLTNDQKIALKNSGIIRFWDSEKYPLEELPLFQERNITNGIKLEVAFLGSDLNFTRKMNSLLKDFQISLFTTNYPVEFFFGIQNIGYSFLIIDWDLSETLSQNISSELKRIKNQIGKIPIIFGLKDFQKGNLFSELSLIKEFCPLLFSKEEFLSLMINSLPFTNSVPFEKEELNTFDCRFSRDGKLLSALVVKKESELIDSRSQRQKKLYDWILH
ncbi:MAG: hypothetical protein IT569_09035 [Leptospiraceae bacterium]|nr:hypothetical protein [Leptospiraceae bacterium]